MRPAICVKDFRRRPFSANGCARDGPESEILHKINRAASNPNRRIRGEES